MSERDDHHNAIVIDLLKVTTAAGITTGEAMEIAMRLFVGIALNETAGNPRKAARLLERATKNTARWLRDPTTKISPTVKDGQVVN